MKMINKPQNTGERIEYKRKELKLSYITLGGLIGISPSSIQRYCKGTIKKIPTEMLYKFAEVFEVDVDWLSGLSDIETKPTPPQLEKLPPNFKSVPLLGEIACGSPILAEELAVEFIVSNVLEADFCLRAKGDSMINANINEGDIVFIKSQNMVNNGEIAVVLIDNDATLKRVYYYPNENTLLLHSENSKYKPMVYMNEELNQINILGKALKAMIDIF